eukprot:Gb_35874 [translate_table: standard]
MADFSGEYKKAQQIAKAAGEWGFFRIINHGIPASLIAGVQAVSKDFFDLPMEQKEVYATKPGMYFGYQSKLVQSLTERLDWGDRYFNIAWPPSRRDPATWPAHPSAFMETMDEYSRQVFKLWERLMQALSVGLGLHQDSLNEAVGGDKMEITFAINYYPPCPQPELAFGRPAHCDPNVLTVLLVDSVRGLQIRKDSNWILNNGKYKSVEHRAVVNKEATRMSWAMFCSPPREAIVSPLKELIGRENPPLYKPACYREYILEILNQRAYGKNKEKAKERNFQVV